MVILLNLHSKVERKKELVNRIKIDLDVQIDAMELLIQKILIVWLEVK